MLFNLSVTHDDDLVANRHCLALVMGDIQAGRSNFSLNPAEFVPHVFTKLRIKIGKRFIEKKYLRFGDDGTRQCDPLLLSTGNLVWHSVGILADSHQVEHLPYSFFHLGFWYVLYLQTIGYVFPDIQMRKKSIALEHHANVSLVRRNTRHITSPQDD